MTRGALETSPWYSWSGRLTKLSDKRLEFSGKGMRCYDSKLYDGPKNEQQGRQDEEGLQRDLGRSRERGLD